ncbi:hypothetical protein L207DRAFT_20648 [Hyaloscypha variabilis F]|uniref:Uncharacterized protein n=1 Tax=Hyaloscypha variabilis (strain UAMH 11265 / GT02V1 / F) TaxID=1149755 RepID=A0A2J6SE92_HYAVF|nr:hypothetical protein L207DRAFT_20648 [Hyaloscypha variabilis F]
MSECRVASGTDCQPQRAAAVGLARCGNFNKMATTASFLPTSCFLLLFLQVVPSSCADLTSDQLDLIARAMD